MELSDADVDYVRRNYFTLDDLCAGRRDDPDETRELIARGLLPAASYVLGDGTEMFPADWFVLIDQAGGHERLRGHFAARHRRAGGDPADLEDLWDGYLRGVYGVCLRQVLPETILRKCVLVDSLHALLFEPAPGDETWCARVRREVCELDALEREFSPDYDRNGRFGRPPTRDLLITAARERHPQLFTLTEREGGLVA